MSTETFGNEYFSVSFHWDKISLVGTTLHPFPVPSSSICSPFGQELRDLIANYAQISRDAWPDLPIDLTLLPPFSRSVLTVLRTSIPRGTWISYAELAKACGSPRAARPVGSVMAKNPWALVIPCHRVLASGKKIGGFGPGTPLKRTLLELEGITL